MPPSPLISHLYHKELKVSIFLGPTHHYQGSCTSSSPWAQHRHKGQPSTKHLSRVGSTEPSGGRKDLLQGLTAQLHQGLGQHEPGGHSVEAGVKLLQCKITWCSNTNPGPGSDMPEPAQMIKKKKKNTLFFLFETTGRVPKPQPPVRQLQKIGLERTSKCHPDPSPVTGSAPGPSTTKAKSTQSINKYCCSSHLCAAANEPAACLSPRRSTEDAHTYL